MSGRECLGWVDSVVENARSEHVSMGVVGDVDGARTLQGGTVCLSLSLSISSPPVSTHGSTSPLTHSLTHSLTHARTQLSAGRTGQYFLPSNLRSDPLWSSEVVKQ